MKGKHYKIVSLYCFFPFQENLILDLKNKNTIIIVTHEPALFDGIPSRILFLEKGKIKNFIK